MADDIKRGSTRRNVKLASIPVGMAGRAALGAAKRLTGKSRDEVNATVPAELAAHYLDTQLTTMLVQMAAGQAPDLVRAQAQLAFASLLRA